MFNLFKTQKSKNPYPHASVDIETLSVEADAVITELAVTLFDADSIGPTYSWLIDWQNQNRAINAGTILWVLKNRSISERLLISERVPLKDALLKFSDWINSKTYVWANSPSFDLAILKNSMESYGLKAPWNFRNERDLRTIMHSHPYSEFTDFKNEAKHTAAGDAEYQAKIIQRLLKL